MFNFCLILNAAPFYVLAQNETDLEELLKTYQDKVAAVVKSSGLEVMEFKLQMSLFSKPTMMIPHIIEENQDYLAKNLSDSEQDELINDLTVDIN